MAGAMRTILPPLLLAAALLAVLTMPEPRPTPVTERPDETPPSSSGAAPAVRLRTVALPPPPRPVRQPGPPARVHHAEEPMALPEPSPVVPTAADAGRGRLLLDRVAKGEGPAIEIAWPDDPAARRELVGHLERCAGWRILLLVEDRIWRSGDPPGRAWTPTRAQAPSGLLRDLDGPAADRAAVSAIRARHGLSGGRPVGAVARSWDARLLGGLGRLLGPGWTGSGDLGARYATDGGRLAVVDVRLDGRAVPGRVDLGPLSRCAR
ncbi:hypothetical protein GCM10017083_53050 [Thalassobaculum fulvum]|uniref:Uncharacterized protein n=1 Tax=Thalassobaculum fulvum TaxID=1633335 RepID=A0A918XX57_9PROT|nr:hypothetical protein [Thalassobaculum fulvum]GHD63191.1 hypothetical protein GCM10017083_53050 [Thalassobaculum fulvum]